MKKAKQKKKSPYAEPRKLIRLAVTEQEHALIRVAAARCDLPMSEFCRKAAIDDARKLEKTVEK